MLSKHDELLLKDLNLQPLWLLWLYVALGVFAAGIGLVISGASLGAMLCVGGGFLVALGAEKLVTRRIRDAAASVIRNMAAPHRAPQPTHASTLVDEPSSTRAAERER